MSTGGFCPDYSRPYSAEFMNAWSYTSASPHTYIAWYLIKHRGSSTLPWSQWRINYQATTDHIILIGQRTRGGPGSVVGIATAYGLDGPGIESWWGGEVFSTCPDRSWGPPTLLYNEYRVFPGGNLRPRRDADPSPPSSAEVKNKIEL